MKTTNLLLLNSMIGIAFASLTTVSSAAPPNILGDTDNDKLAATGIGPTENINIARTFGEPPRRHDHRGRVGVGMLADFGGIDRARTGDVGYYGNDIDRDDGPTTDDPYKGIAGVLTDFSNDNVNHLAGVGEPDNTRRISAAA